MVGPAGPESVASACRFAAMIQGPSVDVALPAVPSGRSRSSILSGLALSLGRARATASRGSSQIRAGTSWKGPEGSAPIFAAGGRSEVNRG